MVRHILKRQPAAHMRADDMIRDRGGGRVVAHQSLRPSSRAPQHNSTSRYSRQRSYGRLDVAGIHANTAQLDEGVAPAYEVQIAIRSLVYAIASSIETDM